LKMRLGSDDNKMTRDGGLKALACSNKWKLTGDAGLEGLKM
jgi:hypothetical protein